MEACSLLVNLREGMQGSSEQPLVGGEGYVTTPMTAAKETTKHWKIWKRMTSTEKQTEQFSII